MSRPCGLDLATAAVGHAPIGGRGRGVKPRHRQCSGKGRAGQSRAAARGEMEQRPTTREWLGHRGHHSDASLGSVGKRTASWSSKLNLRLYSSANSMRSTPRVLRRVVYESKLPRATDDRFGSCKGQRRRNDDGGGEEEGDSAAASVRRRLLAGTAICAPIECDPFDVGPDTILARNPSNIASAIYWYWHEKA